MDLIIDLVQDMIQTSKEESDSSPNEQSCTDYSSSRATFDLSYCAMYDILYCRIGRLEHNRTEDICPPDSRQVAFAILWARTT